MTDDEATAIATKAAHMAVNEAFNRLGIDVSDWQEVQKDMAFVRDWRESSEAIKRQGVVALAVAVLIGLAGLVWAALKGG